MNIEASAETARRKNVHSGLTWNRFFLDLLMIGIFSLE